MPIRHARDPFKRPIGTTPIAHATVSAVLVFLLFGCSDDFDPFNLLTKTRILAIRADPPTLAPGETATLTPLVFTPDPAPPSFDWRWCPITKGRADGFECAVTEAALRDAVAEINPAAAAEIPPFHLGTGPTAAFDFGFSPLLVQAICNAAIAEEIPAFVDVPDCDAGLRITIRLTTTATDVTAVAIKDLYLVADASETPNANPSIGQIQAVLQGASPTEVTILHQDSPAMLAPGASYDLKVSIPDTAAELFDPEPTEEDPDPPSRRESLFMTWFITAGETTDTRSTFIDGEIPLARLGENTWDLPDADDLSEPTARLYLVIQDERGGVNWQERTIALAEKDQ
ncbi:MAG: hypothetical protein QNJ97_06020 [Myxococcota bacterium]|nr:hypothetical protein [Myxococcota bacterium]